MLEMLKHLDYFHVDCSSSPLGKIRHHFFLNFPFKVGKKPYYVFAFWVTTGPWIHCCGFHPRFCKPDISLATALQTRWHPSLKLVKTQSTQSTGQCGWDLLGLWTVLHELKAYMSIKSKGNALCFNRNIMIFLTMICVLKTSSNVSRTKGNPHFFISC